MILSTFIIIIIIFVDKSAKKELGDCLTDPDQDKYTPNEIIQKWTVKYPERDSMLLIKGKSHQKIQLYLSTWECLRSPLGIYLVGKIVKCFDFNINLFI